MAEDGTTKVGEEGAQAARPSADELMAQVAALESERDKAVAESRKWETRSKSNAEKARAYDELAAKSMTDAERADAASKRAEEAEAELARYRRADERREWERRAAEKTGVPADVLSSMEAESAEDLMKRAEAIKGYFEAPAAPVVATEGVQPPSPSAGETANDWLRSTIRK